MVRGVQGLLDTYGVGVHVVGMNLLSVHAPDEVHAAFRDVASAQEDKILIVNRATTFAQEAVNLAEGDAAAMIESARAFKDEKILQAEGDALAFTLREKEYRGAPDLTRFRLHLEALEEILPASQRILRPGRADVKDFDLWLLQPPGEGRRASETAPAHPRAGRRRRGGPRWGLWSCFVVIDVTEYGLVLRFGRVVRVVREPGLYLKRPLPARDRGPARPAPAPLQARDRRVPQRGQEEPGGPQPCDVAHRRSGALPRHHGRPSTAERAPLRRRAHEDRVGRRQPSLTALVSVDGHTSQFDQVMGQIVKEARRQAIAQYGIDLVDIRLRQFSLPEQNRANVFARMQAERGKIAMKYRSEGEREFKKVVAEADREKARILAEAYREAERTKAEGDAHAMRIYAEAFGKDPQLYKFRRTLQAYEKILGGNTTIFLPADAEIFRLLGDEGRSKAGK